MSSRLLKPKEAAAYCGLTPASFRAWRARGILPGPIKGTYKYDKNALDLAIDRASGIAMIGQPSPISPYDKWKASKNETSIR